jgi:hypothetical protein
MNLYKRKLAKISNQVEKIATKGKDNFIEYYKYIDELVAKGDYAAFEQALYYFYQIDISNYQYLNDVKKKTWDEVLFQTKSDFLKKLSKIYKEKDVYQISYDVFTNNPNAVSITYSNPLSSTYSSTPFTQSISLTRDNEVFKLNIQNSKIQNIIISKTIWANQSAPPLTIKGSTSSPGTILNSWYLGYEGRNTLPDTFVPTQTTVLQRITVSYMGLSNTIINASNLVIGDNFTMSITPNLAYMVGQHISITQSSSHFEGDVKSYTQHTGELVIKVTSKFGSTTQSQWVTNYISGTQSPTYITDIPLTPNSQYVISTEERPDYKFLNYKVDVVKDSLLGQIVENEIYTQDAKYLIQNKQYASLIGARKTYLEVYKVGGTNSYIIVTDSPSLSEQQNLLNRYKIAIDILNS